jgi:phosphohistidine phosphatase SixA
MPVRHTRKRVQLGIIVSTRTKKTVERLAKASGRSQAQVSEELIEKGLAYDGAIAAMMRKLEEIAAAIQAPERNVPA